MVLQDSWALKTSGMNVEEERIIHSPIYVPSSQVAILSVIQPDIHSPSEFFIRAFSLDVRK